MPKQFGFKDPRQGFKVPVLALVSLLTKYKAGKLTLLGLVIAIIVTLAGQLACTQPGVEGCIHWSVLWEATNR